MRHHAIVSSNHDLLFLKSSRLLMITSSCGNIGKVSRITSLLDGSFKILAGFIDFLLPAVSIGSAGAISPLPNIAPVSDFCSNVTSKIFTTSIGVCNGALACYTKPRQCYRLVESQATPGDSFLGRSRIVKGRCE